MDLAEFNNRQKQAGEVGKSFCETYYKTFDTSREQLAPLYHPTHSVMSFEGVPYFGSVDITNHLKGLPFVTAIHAMTSIDCHFTVDNSILVAVLGQIQVDNDPKKSFHQTFMLKQDGNSLFIVNDIFRLGVHNF